MEACVNQRGGGKGINPKDDLTIIVEVTEIQENTFSLFNELITLYIGKL